MRLIDGDALEQSLTEKGDDYKVSMFATSNDCNIARLVAFECAEEVKNAPTIEVEPVRHGKWGEYQIPHIICCSECDYGTCVDEKTKFCPNCGAKMDLK